MNELTDGIHAVARVLAALAAYGVASVLLDQWMRFKGRRHKESD